MHSPKRRRLDDDSKGEDEDEDDYTPYVPVAQRRQALVSRLSNRQSESATQKAKREQLEREEEEDAEKEEERRRERTRKERTLLEQAQEVHKKKADEGECIAVARRPQPSLMSMHRRRKEDRNSESG